MTNHPAAEILPFAQNDTIGVKAPAGFFTSPEKLPRTLEPERQEAAAVIGQAKKSFEPFMAKLMEAGTTGDAEAFFALCDPRGTMGGPYGPGGAIVVARTEEVIKMAEGQPSPKMSSAQDPNEVGIIGCLVAFMAATVNVQSGDAEPVPQRAIAIAYFDAQQEDWKIIFSLEAPLQR